MKRPEAQRRKKYIDPLTSKTDQSFRNEVNVNSIMAKYTKTGQITHLRQSRGQFMDISAVPDLMTAFDIVRSAEKSFMELPAVIRERLGNNPANMQDFILDSRNSDLLIEYGILVPRETAGSTEPAVSTDVPAPKATKAKSKTPAPEVPDTD